MSPVGVGWGVEMSRLSGVRRLGFCQVEMSLVDFFLWACLFVLYGFGGYSWGLFGGLGLLLVIGGRYNCFPVPRIGRGRDR